MTDFVKSPYSSLIVSQIVNELAGNINLKSIQKNNERQRDKRVKKHSVQYSDLIINNLTQLLEMSAEQCSSKELFISKKDKTQNGLSSGNFRRVSILKVKRNSVSERKTKPRRFGSRILMQSRNSVNPLIKLKQQQNYQAQQYSEYIDRLRTKKIKYEQSLYQFDDGDDGFGNSQNQQRILANNFSFKQSSKNKVLITSLSGQILHAQKQVNTKNNVAFEKTKVKPLFKLKQLVESRRQIVLVNEKDAQPKEEQARGVSFTKSKHSKQGPQFKSIIEVISMRKKIKTVKSQTVR